MDGLRRALQSELERNQEIATGTKELINERRDMLQGESRKRIVFHKFHTDAWDSLVRSGRMDDIGPNANVIAECYGALREANELIEAFRSQGDMIMHEPAQERAKDPYGRGHVIDLIAERMDAATGPVQEALAALERAR